MTQIHSAKKKNPLHHCFERTNWIVLSSSSSSHPHWSPAQTQILAETWVREASMFRRTEARDMAPESRISLELRLRTSRLVSLNGRVERGRGRK